MYISYKDVESQCNKLHNLAKKMKSISEDISNVKNTLGSCWKGIAADSYIELLNTVTSCFESVFLSIEDSILYMASCSEGYQALDKNIMDEICGYLNIDSNALLNPNSSSASYEENTSSDSSNETTAETKQESVVLDKGSRVIILDGEYKGKYATISDVNEQNNIYTLNINVGGKVINKDYNFNSVTANVTILDGNYKNMVGTISNIDEKNNEVTLIVNVLGNDMTIKMDMSQVTAKRNEA